MKLPCFSVCVAAIIPLLAAASSFAQPAKSSVRLVKGEVVSAEYVYKETPEGKLMLHGYLPADWKAADKRPAVVFFFGGGWSKGSYTQFTPQCEYFASRGLVALSADYRISSIHKTTPDRCVEDAKSAIRWAKANAAKLGIDPEKVIAAGGSAGAHIAACTALVPGFDSPGDPQGVSSVPAALLLFNPALNLPRRVQDAQGNDISAKISPTRFLAKNAPPTWLTYGDADPMLDQGIEFAKIGRELGVGVELHVAPKQGHGFFNRSPWIESTTRAADAWLVSQGFLQGESPLRADENASLLKR